MTLLTSNDVLGIRNDAFRVNTTFVDHTSAPPGQISRFENEFHVFVANLGLLERTLHSWNIHRPFGPDFAFSWTGFRERRNVYLLFDRSPAIRSFPPPCDDFALPTRFPSTRDIQLEKLNPAPMKILLLGINLKAFFRSTVRSQGLSISLSLSLSLTKNVYLSSATELESVPFKRIRGETDFDRGANRPTGRMKVSFAIIFQSGRRCRLLKSSSVPRSL